MNDVAKARLKNRFAQFLLIALLFSLAVTQPLFDLLGEQAEFFVTYGMSRSSLLLFTLGLAIVLPLAAAAVPWILGWIRPALGNSAFLLLQFLLWLLILLPVASRAGLEGILAIGLSGAVAALCVVAWAAFYPARLTLYYLTPAIAVFPLFFLFASKATELVLPRSVASAPSQTVSGADTDVVVIVLDEFPLASLLTPDMEIDRLRYPNFGRLADASMWYRGATAPSEITTDSVQVALSGLAFEEVHGSLPIHANVPRNLFTLLAPSHEVTALETSTLLCPEDVCGKQQSAAGRGQAVRNFTADLLVIYAHLVVPRPYSEKLPSISHAWAGFGAGAQTPGAAAPSGPAPDDEQMAKRIKEQERWGQRAEEFRGFVDGIEASDRPRLYYLHSLLPHSQWVYLPDGKTYIFNRERVAFGIRPDDDPQRIYFHEWYKDTHAVNQAWQRHLLQVQFVDHLLGELLDKLIAENLFDDALIVLMGDHGASFIPGLSRRDANERTLSDISAVPLFIKFPGSNATGVDDMHVTLADILPTLVAALGLETDWPFDGYDLASRPVLEDREFVTIHHSNGTPVRYPYATHRAHLQSRARDLNRTFGSGGQSRLFNFGPFPELVGTTLESADTGAPAEGQVVLEGASLYLDVELDAGFLPLQIWGRWSGMSQDRLPRQLAIAVNGIIRATTRTYEIPGYHDYFSVLLPENALSSGANRVQVFDIDSAAGRPVLRELAQADQAPMRLLTAEQGARLVLSDGSEYPLQQQPWPGEVETVIDQAGALAYLQGSVKAEPGQQLTLVVMRNGVSINQIQIEGVEPSERGAQNISTFRMPMVYLGEASASSTSLRVLAVDQENGVVRELGYPPLCSPRWIYAPPASWGLDHCNKLHAELPRIAGDEYRVVLKFDQESIRQYMGEGWRVEPDNLSWTIGNRAEFMLPLPEYGGQWSFRATVKPYLAPGKLERQRLVLLAGGRIVGEWSLDHNDFTTLDWNIPGDWADGEGGLTLEFELPDAASPHELGAGADQRQLGLAFSTLVISNRAIGQPD
jgi:hypothetical protein